MENNQSPKVFTPEDRELYNQKFHDIENDIKEHFYYLTPEERIRKRSMGDKSMAFVQKTIQYGREFEMAVPRLLDIDQLEQDYIQSQQMSMLIRKVEKLLEGMKDTRMTSAHRAYSVGLKVYNALRSAEDLEASGIKSAIDDLSKRFSGQGTPKQTDANQIQEENKKENAKASKNDNSTATDSNKNTDMK